MAALTHYLFVVSRPVHITALHVNERAFYAMAHKSSQTVSCVHGVSSMVCPI